MFCLPVISPLGQCCSTAPVPASLSSSNAANLFANLSACQLLSLIRVFWLLATTPVAVQIPPMHVLQIDDLHRAEWVDYSALDAQVITTHTLGPAAPDSDCMFPYIGLCQ